MKRQDRETIVEILESLNRRLACVEIGDEGGGYQETEACRKLIEKFEGRKPQKMPRPAKEATDIR